MAEYTGPTDQVTKVKLTASLEQVMWGELVACPGANVTLEVFTHFVGNAAEMKIQLSDGTGKAFGTFTETLYGNRFWARLVVPAEARRALFADVTLPKHGLSKRSPALLLGPPVRITNLRWSQEAARRHDVLTLTADVEGAPDGTEAVVTIWEHDADGAHDLVTRIPTLVRDRKVSLEWEFVYTDDTDDIATEEEAEHGYHPPAYFFRVTIHGIAADAPLLPFRDWIAYQLTDHQGTPLPERPYVLHLPDGTERSGRLDAEGRFHEEEIPPGPVRVEFPDQA